MNRARQTLLSMGKRITKVQKRSRPVKEAPQEQKGAPAPSPTEEQAPSASPAEEEVEVYLSIEMPKEKKRLSKKPILAMEPNKVRDPEHVQQTAVEGLGACWGSGPNGRCEAMATNACLYCQDWGVFWAGRCYYCEDCMNTHVRGNVCPVRGCSNWGACTWFMHMVDVHKMGGLGYSNHYSASDRMSYSMCHESHGFHRMTPIRAFTSDTSSIAIGYSPIDPAEDIRHHKPATTGKTGA